MYSTGKYSPPLSAPADTHVENGPAPPSVPTHVTSPAPAPDVNRNLSDIGEQNNDGERTTDHDVEEVDEPPQSQRPFHDSTTASMNHNVAVDYPSSRPDRVKPTSSSPPATTHTPALPFTTPASLDILDALIEKGADLTAVDLVHHTQTHTRTRTHTYTLYYPSL